MRLQLTLIVISKYHVHGQAHFLLQRSQHWLNVVLIEDSLPLLSSIPSCKSLHNSDCICYINRQ